MPLEVSLALLMVAVGALVTVMLVMVTVALQVLAPVRLAVSVRQSAAVLGVWAAHCCRS